MDCDCMLHFYSKTDKEKKCFHICIKSIIPKPQKNNAKVQKRIN